MIQNEITRYISEVNRIYKEGITTEHSFRGVLETLLTNMTNCTVINEAQHIKCGAPDLTLLRRNIPVGYVEAKDIGKNLNSKEYKNQFDRYKKALDNLIITDYLQFQLFEGESLVAEIAIGKVLPNKIEPIPENFNAFVEIIKTFSLYDGKAIKDSQKLAEYMAAKTQLLAEAIEKTIAATDENNSLRQQLKGFQQVLLPTMTNAQFADIYAQTIAYGMFVARLQDSSNDNFTRQHAAALIPHSNPFLCNLFQYIAGFDLDENIRWIVDSLADMFNYVDVTAIHKEFVSKDKDPFLHFYEDFLTKYDKSLKTAMGAYYTPLAVVKFIVKAVDDILKTDFNISNGLADTSMVETPFLQRFHRVQILDPATGTGTFLAEVVRAIYHQFANNAGMWNDYVKNHLIPRLNGFEIMMSPYTMAHLKMEMILQETGYTSRQNDTTSSRLHIYLTDALEVPKKDMPQIPFAQWLSNEANEAAKIKNNVPVMVVLGNPPYSGESKNKNEWIMRLMEDYKKEPDANSTLQERNPKWINDDYCKFIRLGQFFVDKNSEGVLAYINNHSFIDNPTFRGMRWNLMKSFDKIYIIDLHGNSKKKEICPDGSKDENVFDIQQGVSINIFVKTGRKAKDTLAEVYHFDLYGKRKEKYDYLFNNKLSTVPFIKLQPTSPEYFFVPKNYETKEDYEKGFNVQELFSVNSVGIVTANDEVLIKTDEDELSKSVQSYYNIVTDEKFITPILYRPFDKRYVYYDTKLIERSREKVMRHFLKRENIGLIINKPAQGGADIFTDVFIASTITDQSVFSAMKRSPFICPLYLYLKGDIGKDGVQLPDKKTPNLNEAIINEISQRIKLQFTAEKEDNKNTFAPIDILDYIYAVLHSPTYRECYKEFLKIDFPRVPHPKNAKQFWKLVELGGILRRLHLLEGVEPQQGMAEFPVRGSNKVEKLQYTNGKVYINNTQYFDHVPPEAWNCYIGGYQPAQKWLKDRKGRILGYDDVWHYQRIIRVLKETGEVMREVDKVMGKAKQNNNNN